MATEVPSFLQVHVLVQLCFVFCVFFLDSSRYI